jgi:hypothetical protein
MAFTTNNGGQFLPYDENTTWREIYARLAEKIGPRECYSWFGHCRFVRLQSDTLELSHWLRFGARTCVGKYGAELAKAAKVSNVRIYRAGGYKPVWVETPVVDRAGYETFTLHERAA